MKVTDVAKLSGAWWMSGCCKGLADPFENSSAKMLCFYAHMSRGSNLHSTFIQVSQSDCNQLIGHLLHSQDGLEVLIFISYFFKKKKKFDF